MNITLQAECDQYRTILAETVSRRELWGRTLGPTVWEVAWSQGWRWVVWGCRSLGASFKGLGLVTGSSEQAAVGLNPAPWDSKEQC